MLIQVQPQLGEMQSVSVAPVLLHFDYVGESLPLQAIGTTKSGVTRTLTGGARLSWTATNTSVVLVRDGLAVAVGPGTTDIIATYEGLNATVSATVAAAIRGDLNNDGRIDQDDLNILLDALNTTATRPADARDLNNDGKIDALDLRILTTLCTKPRCAY